EKIESKEIKREKIEIKEKREILEGPITKIPDLDPKGPFEGPQLPTGPIQPGGPIAGGSLEERIAQLEAPGGTLSAFIGPELRPDLSAGALTGEADVQQTSQQLQKAAADAMQAKVSFDNKMGG